MVKIKNHDHICFTGTAYADHTKYWAEKLEASTNPFRLIGDISTNIRDNAMQQKIFAVAPKHHQIIAKLAKNQALESFILAFSSYCMVFAKYQHNHIIIDTPPLRNTINNTDVLITNSIPIITHLAFDQTIKEVIIHINQTITKSYQYQNFPLELIANNKNLDTNQYTTNVLLLNKSLHYDCSDYERYDLIINIDENQSIIDYKTCVFSETFVTALARHYHRIISAFSNIDTVFRTFRLPEEKEQQQVLIEFNATRTDYPRTQSLAALFAEQVLKTPDEIALIADESLTYRQLNEQANQLAHYLHNYQQIQPDDIIAIVMDSSAWLIIAIFGILKAGGAYLPIASDTPIVRIKMLVEDSCAAVVITDNSHIDLIQQSCNSVTIALELLFKQISGHSHENLPIVTSATSLAYVMYTSGSTGTPKGVLVENKNVVRLVKNNRYLHIESGDQAIQLSNIAFDGSVFDIFATLLNGATLHLLPHHHPLSTDNICTFMQDRSINIAFITTALFNNIIDFKPNIIRQFKKIYFGGQAASPHHVETARRYCQHQETLVHVYGPTENTTFSTYYIVPENNPTNTIVPIGIPISNTQIYILDQFLSPQPIGVEGEIYVGGDGVCRGYLEQPTLNKQVFLDNPFVAGERLYKTGDRGRWSYAGQIEFLGRQDEQVKIRGFRVEPREIEHILNTHAHISQVCITTIKTPSENKELVAYIVADIKAHTIRDFLSQILPDYMVPAHIVLLEHLPLNANGKIDRSLLPPPEDVAFAEYNAPRNVIEKHITSIWQTILAKKKIGVTDNYFSHGGDSIKAMQIATELHAQNLKLEVRDILEQQTIEKLALLVTPITIDTDTDTNNQVVTGTVPLTPIQTWFFQAIADAHFNQSVMLFAKQRLQAAALRDVFASIVQHHDALRMRYRSKSGVISQEILGFDYPLDFTVFDLRCEKDPQTTFLTLANRLHTSIDMENGPLMKVALLQLKEDDRLLVIIHHLVIDAVSWRILLTDIQQGYRQAIAGQTIKLPAKTTSFKRWSEVVLEYSQSAHQNPALAASTTYWQQLATAVIPPLPRDISTGCSDTGCEQDARTVEFSLSTDSFALPSNPHNTCQTEIIDLLLTAFAQAMYRWQGTKRTVIDLVGNGREPIFKHINVNRTIGWFTSIYPVVVDLPIETSWNLQVNAIKTILRDIPANGIDYGILKYLSKTDFGTELQPQICFNYLGVFENQPDDPHFGLIKESIGLEYSPQLKRHYELEVVGMVIKSQLQFAITYNQHHYQTATMQNLAMYFKTALQSIYPAPTYV